MVCLFWARSGQVWPNGDRLISRRLGRLWLCLELKLADLFECHRRRSRHRLFADLTLLLINQRGGSRLDLLTRQTKAQVARRILLDLRGRRKRVASGCCCCCCAIYFGGQLEMAHVCSISPREAPSLRVNESLVHRRLQRQRRLMKQQLRLTNKCTAARCAAPNDNYLCEKKRRRR